MSKHVLGPEHQLTIQLQQMASEYAEASGGVMATLPYDPEIYPGQDGFVAEGKQQSPAIVDGIAGLAQPKFNEISKLLEAQEIETQEVSRIGELLIAGNNVILAFNHGNLIDIAIGHAAFYSRLNQLEYEMRTGIMISKMIAFLAYKIGSELAPAVQTLQLLEDTQYLSYPRTASAKKKGILGKIFSDEVDTHNRDLREELGKELGKGSMLLALAASGTTDKPTKNNPGAYELGALGSGTVDIMQTPGTVVVPVAVWFAEGDPTVFDICDIPRVVEGKSDADTMMETIAERLTESIPDKSFTYLG